MLLLWFLWFSDKGQLGLGDTRSHSLPRLVESLEGLDIKTVAAGGSHSLAFNDFFKAAQELVFMHRVKAFQELQKTGGTKLFGDDDPDGLSAAAREAERNMRLVQSPRRRADFGLGSPNPLVPLALKAMLREVAPEEDEPRGQDVPAAAAAVPSPRGVRPSASASSSSSSLSLSIELVHSSHVQCTHRFFTFQTWTPEAQVRAMFATYLSGSHAKAEEVLLQQLMLTPGNTINREDASHAGGASPRDDALSSTHLQHTFHYAPHGPPRWTLLLVLSVVSSSSSLWPPWAADFHALLRKTCSDVAPTMASRRTEQERAAADPAQPCFRELRPIQTARR
jgi:hypothetical protein